MSFDENVPCRRLWRLPWFPLRCQCPSSFAPSWWGTRESQLYRCLHGYTQKGTDETEQQSATSRINVLRSTRETGTEAFPGLWTSPSASTSLIMSWSSASVGFCPSERMTVPSSLVVMVPSPSLSNSENASLNSGNGHRWRRQGRDEMSAERKPPPKGTSLHPHETWWTIFFTITWGVKSIWNHGKI